MMCSVRGKAARPFARAHAQGRLCDFFVVVARMLDTSAPGHAYVELDAWYGSECSDCGTTLSNDEGCALRRVRGYAVRRLPGDVQLVRRRILFTVPCGVHGVGVGLLQGVPDSLCHLPPEGLLRLSGAERLHELPPGRRC